MSQEVENNSSNVEQDFRAPESKSKFTGFNLLQKFSYDHLEALKNIFKNKTSLDKKDFVEAIESFFDNQDSTQEAIQIFEEIIVKKENETINKINWTDFLDFFILNLNKESPRRVALSISNMQAASHVKKESIVKIVLIETDKYFCYAMVSKHGRVGLYDGNLNFLTSYHLIMTREDISRKEEERRRRNRWVTDAIFCADILMFIVTNSARSVVFYEASGLKHVPMWLILSTPNIVECFAYKAISNGTSCLFMGDCRGGLISFNFLQPKVSPLRKKFNDKISLFYWDELPNEKDFLVVKFYGKCHKDCVKHVQYFHDNGTIITSSRDPEASVVIKYLGNKGKSYVFKMKRGCNCFSLSRCLKILVTGSDDGLLRIWNPIIASKPVALLRGHQAGIVDVRIMDRQKVFVSCCRDGYLKLWDVDDQKCIQTLVINFPSFSVFGKLIEWGIESLYPGPKRIDNIMEDGGASLEIWERSMIVVSCCNYIASVKLNFEDKTIEGSFESKILLPPPLQNSVLIPKSWKIDEHVDLEGFGKVSNNKTPGEEKVDQKIIEDRINEYKFILDKDLLAEYGTKSDINFKIARLENKKMEMQQHVARGAPYLALDLYEVENLKLTPGLPIPNKRTKSLVEKLDKILEDANARDIIFSEPSSSRSTPRSSRSSVVEFEY